MKGDLEGTQDWTLSADNGGTRTQLHIEFAAPEWLPAYLHDDEYAARWTKTLVEQTLARIKSALEASS